VEAIWCQGLARRYGKVEALKGLDLAVEHGSIFGYLGRNGAGKTTTIKLLTGLAKPSSGDGWVDGVKTTDGSHAGRRRFGYMPETPAFYGWMKPHEYLDYVAQLHELDQQTSRRRTSELLEMVGLEETRGRRIGGFSRGMRQRLALAQAMIHRPSVLFLDEPTSALDPAGRRDVLDLIDGLRGRTTVFLSSHILGDVERVCDTIGVIHEGALVTVDSREGLMSRYDVNAVQVELGTGMSLPQGLLDDLRAQPWTRELLIEGPSVRITVSNVDRGKHALLPLLASYDLPFNRVEWLRPTLEEVFLEISS
jgi:ABC-2 type transport system ATP-binding protein